MSAAILTVDDSASLRQAIRIALTSEGYSVTEAADGAEGRLVGLHAFSEDWTSWEMHPAGDELVVCIAGEMALIQELPGGKEARLVLAAGDYAINPPGVWHTADIAASATAIFVTCGMGTQSRPR